MLRLLPVSHNFDIVLETPSALDFRHACDVVLSNKVLTCPSEDDLAVPDAKARDSASRAATCAAQTKAKIDL